MKKSILHGDGSGYDIDREQCINGNDICTN